VLGVTDTGARFPHKVTMHSGLPRPPRAGHSAAAADAVENVRDMTYVELPTSKNAAASAHVQRQNAGHVDRHGKTKAANIAQDWADVVCSIDISCLMHGRRHSPPRSCHQAHPPDARRRDLGSRRQANGRLTMPHNDLHLEGASFWKKETVGLAEPHGSKSLGEAAERSTKHNQELIAPSPSGKSGERQPTASRAMRSATSTSCSSSSSGTSRPAVPRCSGGKREQANSTSGHRAGAPRQVGRQVENRWSARKMELNHTLEAAGIRPVETDLASTWCNWLASGPSHIVTPACTFRPPTSGKLFSEKLGEPFTAEHQALTTSPGVTSREDFIQADMGISA